jgi:hypothetical protein
VGIQTNYRERGGAKARCCVSLQLTVGSKLTFRFTFHVSRLTKSIGEMGCG